MVRWIGLLLALSALFAAPASARPKLTLHRALMETGHAARWDRSQGWVTRYRIVKCSRDNPRDSVRAWCHLREWGDISQPGSPEGRGDRYLDFYLDPKGALRIRSPLGTDWV